jgi:hypothetical protein
MVTPCRGGRSWLVAAALTLSPSIALAQTGDQQNKVIAQALFEEGQKLMAAEDFPAACQKLAESERVDPATGTKFYLAECLSHTGQLATAWNYYVEVAEESAKDHKKEREDYAKARIEKLRPRLPKLSVVVSAEARAVNGLSISRDGVSMGEAQFGVAIPVDLGPHTVHVTAPHRKPWDGTVEAKQEGESLELKVPPLDPEQGSPLAPRATPPATSRSDSSPDLASPPASSSEHGGPWRTAGYVVGGVGVVGVGMGVAFGAVAIAKTGQSGSDCPKDA